MPAIVHDGYRIIISKANHNRTVREMLQICCSLVLVVRPFNGSPSFCEPACCFGVLTEAIRNERFVLWFVPQNSRFI